MVRWQHVPSQQLHLIPRQRQNNATTTATKQNQTSYFTEKDYDTSYDESTASKIELSGSSANVSEMG